MWVAWSSGQFSTQPFPSIRAATISVGRTALSVGNPKQRGKTSGLMGAMVHGATQSGRPQLPSFAINLQNKYI